MKKTLYLNDRETESFYELLEVKKDLISMALYKVNIPKRLHHEFYSYGLEGLLVSFLILNEGKIEEKDFDFEYLSKNAMIDACAPGNPFTPTLEETIAFYKELF